MDTYYESIKEHTFETKFEPFSIPEAKALMAAYDHLQARSFAPFYSRKILV